MAGEASISPTWREMGYQQLTSLNTAATLTVPTGANIATLQAETKDVRYRSDGTAPTASVGSILYAGADPSLYFGNLSALKLIEVSASAKLNVHYFHDPSRVPA